MKKYFFGLIISLLFASGQQVKAPIFVMPQKIKVDSPIVDTQRIGLEDVTKVIHERDSLQKKTLAAVKNLQVEHDTIYICDTAKLRLIIGKNKKGWFSRILHKNKK